MDDSKPLGPGNVSLLVSVVADGTATTNEARALLAEFVRQANTGRVSPRMIEHLRDCFAAYLAGKKTLMPAPEVGRPGLKTIPIPTMEKAFGLSRVTRGRPAIDRDTHCAVAMEVLARMLQGETLEEVSEFVAADRRGAGLPISSETDVRDTWAKHQMDGLLWLRISRLREFDPSALPWSPEEITRLTEMFGGKPWFVPPGVDPKAFMDATLARLDGRSENVTPENSENKPA